MKKSVFVAPFVLGPTVSAAMRRAEPHWAFRATNYKQLRDAGLPRTSASPSTTAISSHLVLEAVEPDRLREGDVLLLEAGQTVPTDGIILEGMAEVDESSITGQSAPVIRHEAGIKEVMRDSRIVAGQIFVEVAPRRGHPLDWIDGTVMNATVRAKAEQL